jgi:peptidoglycan/LPS O-acetylase OafA/YrhL
VPHVPWPDVFWLVLGDPVKLLRLTPIFFVGGCFFLFKDWITFRKSFALGAVAALVGLTLAGFQFEAVLVVFWSYLLFYFSTGTITWLSWMDGCPDISYGVYLYGWPVENLIISRIHWHPVFTFLLSVVICFFLAWLSWTFVEGPALLLKRKKVIQVIEPYVHT